MCLYCACRLRILLGDYKCPICKTNLPQILITKNPSARFEDYPELETEKNGHGIICDTTEAQEAYLKIQSLNCWLPNCRNPKNNTIAQVKKHMESHKLKFCNVCLKSRLIFIWEQKCYTFSDFKRHMEFGDDDTPLHRECLFCRAFFYDENELRSHLEGKHNSCNICEEKNFIYYENYEKLKIHYQKAHYMCHDPICGENRFAVFRTPYDLQYHTLNFHMNKDKMTKAQIQQFTSIKIIEEQPARPNTEGIDFSAQLCIKKNQEEVKHHVKNNSKSNKTKNYVRKIKKPSIVDYKNLPKKPEKEVIEMIKEAMGNAPEKFEEFKSYTQKYMKNEINADILVNKFFELAGEIQAEVIFPILITTVKSSEKQEDMHKEYVKYIESKQNISADGKCCNQFTDTSMDASLFRILTEVIEAELNSRPEDNTRKSFFVHPSQLIQMAAIIDKLTVVDMCKLMYIMNFGIPDKVKTAIINMIERANDVQFNASLQVKYEDFFLKDIDSQHLYIIHKYCEMCLAKLQNRPIKEDAKLLNNWEESKTNSAKKEEEKEEEENKGDCGWASVLVKKNAKVPSNIEKNFPSLAAPASKEPTGWGKSTKSFYSESNSFMPAQNTSNIVSGFPSLEQNSFPSLTSDYPENTRIKPVEKIITVDPVTSVKQPVDEMQFLIEKGFHITSNNKRGKKKRGK